MSNKAPYLFCDVDGVINALIYSREWISDKPMPYDWWDEEYTKKENWGLRRFEADPATDFVVDTEVVIDYPRTRWSYNEKGEGYWETYQVDKVQINYSSELVTELRALIVSGKVDFYWLTAWRERAVNILNPILGFPLDTPFLPWQERGMSDYNQAGKGISLRHLFSEKYEMDQHRGYKTYVPLTPAEAKAVRKPFIWLDDVANRTEANFPKYESRSAKKYGFKKRYGMNNLIINTIPETGISRAELEAIKKFAEDPSSHNPPMPRKTAWDREREAYEAERDLERQERLAARKQERIDKGEDF